MAKENMLKKRVNRTLIPRSYCQYCKSLESQLPGTAFVTIFEWFPFTSDRLKQVKTIERARWDLIEGDRLIRCRLIQVRLY